MKRLVLVLALALVLVGSASAEPLATYEYTFEFGGSGSGSGSGSGGSDIPIGYDLFGYPSDSSFTKYYSVPVGYLHSYEDGTGSVIYREDEGYFYLVYGGNNLIAHPYKYIQTTKPSGSSIPSITISNVIYYNGVDVTSAFTQYNPIDVSSMISLGSTIAGAQLGYRYYEAGASDSGFSNVAGYGLDYLKQYVSEYSLMLPNCFVIGELSVVDYPNVAYSVVAVPLNGYTLPNNPDFTVTMVSEVQEPWFDLFGMRGLTASFTPSNPDEDYYILFAGSDSWVGENPDKWIWTRVHGTTNKYKIIFSGNEYTWFVKYNDEIQQFSFTYTGGEGVVPPVIVPDPEPEQPDTPPIIDTPGDIDPNYPSMPDIESPDLTVDFTSGFDEYENMTIYQNIRNMIDGFTSSIAPNIETMQLYQSLQQVIAYLQVVMEQLKEKYAVPIYNILASVSSFVPSICWLAVDIGIIFGMFRFVVHIITGPISSAIRERF